jgi:hypothetical protein
MMTCGGFAPLPPGRVGGRIRQKPDAAAEPVGTGGHAEGHIVSVRLHNIGGGRRELQCIRDLRRDHGGVLLHLVSLTRLAIFLERRLV